MKQQQITKKQHFYFPESTLHLYGTFINSIKQLYYATHKTAHAFTIIESLNTVS